MDKRDEPEGVCIDGIGKRITGSDIRGHDVPLNAVGLDVPLVDGPTAPPRGAFRAEDQNPWDQFRRMRKRRPTKRGGGQPSSCERASRFPAAHPSLIPSPTSRPSKNARSNSAVLFSQEMTTYDAPRGRESHHRAVTRTCAPAHRFGA